VKAVEEGIELQPRGGVHMRPDAACVTGRGVLVCCTEEERTDVHENRNAKVNGGTSKEAKTKKDEDEAERRKT